MILEKEPEGPLAQRKHKCRYVQEGFSYTYKIFTGPEALVK